MRRNKTKFSQISIFFNSILNKNKCSPFLWELFTFLSRSCVVFASVGLFIDAAPCSVQTIEFNALEKRRSSEPMCCWADNRCKMMKRKKKTEKMHQNQNWESWIAIFIWLRTLEIENLVMNRAQSPVSYLSHSFERFFLLWHNRNE